MNECLNLHPDHAGCYYSITNGSDYRGMANYTESSYKCSDWSTVKYDGWNISQYPNSGYIFCFKKKTHCKLVGSRMKIMTDMNLHSVGHLRIKILETLISILIV